MNVQGIGKRGIPPLVLLLLAGLLLSGAWLRNQAPAAWTEEEKALLRTLTLSQLPPLPPDPSNAVGDDPLAAQLGRQLFFDTRLSRTNTFSCAACHRPELNFTDGLPLARALGEARRNTPSIVGTAYSPWLYWDGRKDSLWSQALAPLEDPAEQGSDRMHLVRVLYEDPAYRGRYEKLFGTMPPFDDASRFPAHAGPIDSEPEWRKAWESMAEVDRRLVNTAFANLGKTIAAYERTLLPAPTRVDAYIDGLLAGEAEDELNALLSAQERQGLKLFIGEARCTECHNGPLLTNNEFHNTGLLPLPGEVPDQGRSKAVELVKRDPFNCLGPYSDAAPGECPELEFVREGPDLVGAMRTASLRNLGDTAPFMHKGQFDTLDEVLAHYNEAPVALIGHNDAKPLGLSSRRLEQLKAFLQALNTPLAGVKNAASD